MIKQIHLRFFAYADDANGETDTYEITEECFISLSAKKLSKIEYERNSVFDNGVRQICLTVKPMELNYYQELELLNEVKS